jgi:hypothetical protein
MKTRLFGLKRRWVAVIGAAALTTGILGFVAPAISSADNAGGCDFSTPNNTTPGCLGPLTGSTFAGGDGNLLTSPTTFGVTDWQNVAGLNPGFDLPSGSGDNSFGQGTKEDNPNVTVGLGSIPNNKSDLTRFYEASELSAVNSHNLLYLGWERANSLGTANMDFEINQKTQPNLTSIGAKTLNRTAGDLLVTFDFTNGGGKPTIGLLRWLTAAAGNTASQCFSSNTLPCWGNQVTLDGTDSIGAVNNIDPVSDPLFPVQPNAQLSVPKLQFGETAIDLTKANVFPSGTCEAFGSAFVKSRSSASFTAEAKDFIAPIPVNISNCGTITIHKVTENGDSSFGYTTTGGLTPSTFSLSNGGTQTYNGVPAGASSVTENLTAAQVAAGWTLKSLVCGTVTGTGTSATPSGSTLNITMGAGGTVDCTYTNHINLSPTIATTLSTTTANIGETVTDSATLSGATANAGGTVIYHAYAGANTCTGTDLLNSTKNVTNGIISDSAGFTPMAAGPYSFQAVYSGDGNNNGASSVCSTEQLLVKTNPTIGTTLSEISVDVGSTVHDSATLSGATSDAGGTVIYTAYTDTACTAGARAAGTVTVSNGVVPDSNALAFHTAGTFYWQAVYSGDAKNNPATSKCTDETLVVNKLQPAVSTAQNLIPNDNFILSGATSDAGGSITFNLYNPNDTSCSGTPALTQDVTVNGNGTYSTTNTTFQASTEGTWRWQSSYSGDNNNLPATSSCGTERFTIADS